VQGIDPSEGQLAFARTRPASRVAEFRLGDAMALPFPADRFDAVGRIRPHATFSVVVLPAPLGPSNATTAPAGTSTSTPCSTSIAS